MTDENGPSELVDRMFPAPTSHGIARDDRAVTSVPSGTDTPPQETGATKTR
jgi:branched-chain amino acid transport system substrate-binding protein